MKGKIITTFLLMLIHLSSNCQTSKNLTFESLEKELTKFLINNNDIQKYELKDYMSGKTHIKIIGVQNEYSNGNLKDGIYAFYQTRTHARSYFIIVEKDEFTILNLSNKNGLHEAIKKTLDFCEKSRYCETITNDYVSRLIRVYLNKNINPIDSVDKNCLYGVTDTKDLP